MTHHCHAEGCARKVPPKLLMCAAHWRRVPSSTQRAVWAYYRPGQETRKDPTAGYLVVQAMAVADVAYAEGLWSADQAADHVLARIERCWRRLGTTQERAKLAHALGVTPELLGA